jgi:hypothetical protein
MCRQWVQPAALYLTLAKWKVWGKMEGLGLFDFFPLFLEVIFCGFEHISAFASAS